MKRSGNTGFTCLLITEKAVFLFPRTTSQADMLACPFGGAEKICVTVPLAEL